MQDIKANTYPVDKFNQKPNLPHTHPADKLNLKPKSNTSPDHNSIKTTCKQQERQGKKKLAQSSTNNWQDNPSFTDRG
jgi:hypothetical protein